MFDVHDHDGSPTRKLHPRNIPCTPSCYLHINFKIDRKNNYFWIPELRFPTPALDPNGQVIPGSYRKDKFHRDTILDGEIVNDILEDGTEQLKFLVFDSLIVDNKNLMQ